MGRTNLNNQVKTLAPLTGRPLVSIIIPSFNQGRFIRTTIDSILQQTYRPLEVIVVDGGSRDDTVSVLHSYGDLPELRWTSEPDKGVADAVNKGFARARGAILGIQSSDDWYLPGAVEQAVFEMQSPDAPALVYADFVTSDADGRELFRSRIGNYTLENLLSKQTWVPQPSAFFRSEVLAELSGWNPAYFVCDTEFWFRLAFRYPVKKVAGLWAQRRLHEEQRNRRAQDIVSSYWRMVTESADLQSAPARLQRAARCGAYLTEVRYNPSGSAWRASAALWKAIAEFPSVFPAVKSMPQLLPGRMAVGTIRNRVGRLLRGAPAPSAPADSQSQQFSTSQSSAARLSSPSSSRPSTRSR